MPIDWILRMRISVYGREHETLGRHIDGDTKCWWATGSTGNAVGKGYSFVLCLAWDLCVYLF